MTEAPPVAEAVEPPRTEVNHSDGPIHTGTGNQLNDIRYYESRPRKPRVTSVTPASLRELADRFVAPPGFQRAATVLARSDGLVILSGAAGTGRNAAALMLLRTGITADTVVRFISPDRETSAVAVERRIFEAEDVRDDDRLVLDLSEADGESFAELQDYLPALQPALEQRRAKLVAILPHPHGESLKTELLPFVVEIRRPDMLEILRRRFAAEGLSATDLSGYRDAFGSSSIDALVRVVHRVREARHARPGIATDALLAEILNSAEKRRQRVAYAVKSLEAARPRALLIAAALLHGFSLQTVFLAQERLLESLRVADTEDHALEVPRVEQALAELTLELSVTPEPGQRLLFRDLELPAEVLRHFWDEMPWLRGRLTGWVGDLVESGVGTLDRFDMATVARRFGAQCRRTRDADLAVRLVEKWSDDRYQSQRSAAYTLLEELLDDDGTAPAARQLLYGWSRDARLSDGRAAIVVSACVKILAERYLDQAVVRLFWLADHSAPDVRLAAQDGLRQLAAEPGRRLAVIDAVLERWRFDPAKFAAVAAPELLSIFRGTAALERIVAGWQRALLESEGTRQSTLFRLWLRAYAEALTEGRSSDADAVQRLLAQVCAHHRELLDALFTTTLEWLDVRGDDPIRRRTAQVVEELVRRGRRLIAPEADS
ncbi:hypothetical protein HPO96_25675 [Kribbella sandramycini]|uniref:Uncharacterized protein n=1 Tax=Kribbella sandramycini TaxID=60450 RepID=A0A7Y4P1G0_9ACTN|nr:hypothetical protein [Kribbella sandramycini]MBB6570495.1 hypothetical protein [Kribbella sandramycini]NOL43641.1 hypothetical protein [Kribbella sandramycini]